MPVQCVNFCDDNCQEEYQDETTRNCLHAVLKIKTKDGWKSIDSPFDPVQEATEMIGTTGADDSDYLVLGAGSGFVARELINRNLKSCLMITGASILAKRNKKIIYDTANGSKDFTIICSPAVSNEIFRMVHNFIESHPRARIVVHNREIKAFPALFNPLLVYIESIRMPPKGKKNFTPKRILFPLQGQIFEPDIRQELALMGIMVISAESFAHTCMDHRKAWDMLCRYAPDMIFSVNNRGADRNGFITEGCVHAGIAWATWFLDQPLFLVHENETRPLKNRFAFCWDTAGVDPCSMLGFDTVELLPLGTNHRIFTPGAGQSGLEGRLVYVGSPSFGNEENYFAALRKNKNADRVAEVLKKQVIQKRSLPAYQEIRKALDDLGISENSFSHSELRRLPAFVLYKANLAYRIDALQSVADLRPVVYGEGWEGLLPETIELRPYTDYYRDLPTIYRSDAVHLSLTHLQMRHYPNQRVFDVGACGRVALGERLAGTRELFGNSFNNLFFDDFRQLREKAVMLLKNKTLRKTLGSELRTVVLQQHTIAHRVEKMLGVIQRAGG